MRRNAGPITRDCQFTGCFTVPKKRCHRDAAAGPNANVPGLLEDVPVRGVESWPPGGGFASGPRRDKGRGSRRR